jgi:RNA polymerase sigma-70 factor (ECF subfamily)
MTPSGDKSRRERHASRSRNRLGAAHTALTRLRDRSQRACRRRRGSGSPSYATTDWPIRTGFRQNVPARSRKAAEQSAIAPISSRNRRDAVDPTSSAEITQLLCQVEKGDRSVVGRLMPLLYEELHAQAQRYLSREARDHTLQPTALVHEAYLKLVDQSRVQWQGRSHFLAVGAQIMRRVLVDHARGRKRLKRGGDRERIALDEGLALSVNRDEDLLAVDEALKKLADLDPRQARIVELRFFAGMTVAEVAEVLDVSKRTVEAEWTAVRAWLRRELDPSRAS